MAAYYDIYLYTKPDGDGHAPNEIYAHVPVIDPTDGTVLAYLCRVNEDQYNYMVENGIDHRTWDTLPTTGKKSRIKVKTKDKDGKDKSIPTIVFGEAIHCPNGKIIKPDKSIQEEVQTKEIV